jgi:hypothetical protein
MDDLTCGQLIHQLQTVPPDTPVRLALRPEFPFSHQIGPITDATVDGTLTVYLSEGAQDGYLPLDARQTLAWPRTCRP